MNNIFSFRRFWNLLRYDGKSNFSMIFWRIVGCCLVFYLLYYVASFFVPLTMPIKMRFDLMYLISIVGAAVTASAMTRYDKRKNVSDALVPASNFEKFMSVLLLSIVVTPVLVACMSFVCDALFTFLPAGPFLNYLWEAETEMTTGMSVSDTLTYEYFAQYDSVLHAILGLLFVVVLVLCGNLVLGKNGAKKTISVFFIFFLVFVLVAEQYKWFGCDRIKLDDGREILSTSVAMRNVILHFRNFNHFVLMPVLLVLSYIKLKTLKY